jgi:predicted regulator of Ras-like GTPase activity (Roadblock/LC7/MglB family)
MSFESILREIVESCNGGLGIVLMGTDGIPIAQVAAGPRPGREVLLADDIGMAGVEFASILAEIGKASDALGGGVVTETVVCLTRFSLLFRQVDEDTLLVLALEADGNLGKARYLMRRHLLAIRQEM